MRKKSRTKTRSRRKSPAGMKRMSSFDLDEALESMLGSRERRKKRR